MEQMHIDDIKSLARKAHDDAVQREALFETLLHGEGREAYYAAWALTHLPPSDNGFIAEHREALTDFAIATENTSLRRLVLALLERLEWGVDVVRSDLLDFSLQHLSSPDEADGVRALCIKLAYRQCRHYEELCGELRQTLLMLDPALLHPGVKHTRNKILEKLIINN